MLVAKPSFHRSRTCRTGGVRSARLVAKPSFHRYRTYRTGGANRWEAPASRDRYCLRHSLFSPTANGPVALPRVLDKNGAVQVLVDVPLRSR
jgi:hypothetical protein